MSDLETDLRDLIAAAEAGKKLPTVRALMHKYGVSQKKVQDVLDLLARDGLVEAYVGRGTYVAGKSGPLFEEAHSKPRSVLMLTRSVGSARTRRVLAGIQAQLLDQGIESIQLTYSSTGHCIQALRSMPRTDLCIIQCHFEAVPIELLAAVRRKCKSILFDGATISGLDVDSVASDWRRTVEVAVECLISSCHKRIGIIGSAQNSRPINAVRAHYEAMSGWHARGVDFADPIWLESLPTDRNSAELESVLGSLIRSDGSLPFTGLLFWGMFEGAKLFETFTKLGIRIPDDLSVIVLGHRGVISESNNFFTVAGACVDETVERLVAMARRRLNDEYAPNAHEFLTSAVQQGSSVAAPRSNTI